MPLKSRLNNKSLFPELGQNLNGFINVCNVCVKIVYQLTNILVNVKAMLYHEFSLFKLFPFNEFLKRQVDYLVCLHIS